MAKTEVQTRDIKDGEVRRDDVNISTSGEALIRKLIAGTGLTIESETGVDEGTGDVTLGLASTQAYTIFPIWAEENGGLSNNNRQWSFGNGSTGNIGIVLPIAAECFAMTMEAEVGGTSVSIELMRNDVAITSELFNGDNDFNILSTPIQFAAGERIGFRTDVETGAYTDVRVCAWFRIQASLLGSSILNDILDVNTTGITTGQILQFNGTNFVPFSLPDTLDRVFTSTITNSTTNINNATFVDIPVFGTNTLINNNGSFTAVSATQVRVNFTGFIEVNANVPYTAGSSRVALRGRMRRNGVAIGPEAMTGYIRNATGHSEASLHISGYYLPVTANDVISFATERESTSTGSATMIANGGTISFRRVKT